MKKCMTMAAALVAVAAMAQEFGGQAAQPAAEPTVTPAASTAEAAPATEVKPLGQGLGVEAILQAQDSEPEPGPMADEMLHDWLETQEGFTTGYDEEHNRIIEIMHVDFSVKNPKVSADFVKLR
ncbi:MAG: hypothetical protein ACI4YA_07560, partial [Candidatus Spyradenecus sp.]